VCGWIQGGQGDGKDTIDALAGQPLNGYIDFKRLRAFNLEDDALAPKLFQREWDDRWAEQDVRSDADEEMMFIVPFSEHVRISAICIMGGTKALQDADAPSKAKIWVNRDDMDFEVAAEVKGDASLDLQRGEHSALLHALPPSKFQNVRQLILFIHKSFGHDTTSLSFIQFRGRSSKISTEKKVVTTVYETTGALQDHRDRVGGQTMKQGFS